MRFIVDGDDFELQVPLRLELDEYGHASMEVLVGGRWIPVVTLMRSGRVDVVEQPIGDAKDLRDAGFKLVSSPRSMGTWRRLEAGTGGDGGWRLFTSRKHEDGSSMLEG